MPGERLNIEILFRSLVDTHTLATGYIFFGPGTQTASERAFSLVRYLEGHFSSQLFQEAMIIRGASGTIGIEAVRRIKAHLSEGPLLGMRRVVIIEQADQLTLQAQNAFLKIAEEPPSSSLIILILNNPEVLLPTLVSRFQKIYFPSILDTRVEDGISHIVSQLLSSPAAGRKKLIKEYLDDERDPLSLIDGLILYLFREKRYDRMIHRALQVRRELASLNLNPRLQLESIFY